MDGVTTHAIRRLRKRIGIPRRSVARAAAIARQNGRRGDELPAPIRRYLVNKAMLEGGGRDCVLHNYAVFVFGDDGALVTCFPLPREYWGML